MQAQEAKNKRQEAEELRIIYPPLEGARGRIIRVRAESECGKISGSWQRQEAG